MNAWAVVLWPIAVSSIILQHHMPEKKYAVVVHARLFIVYIQIQAKSLVVSVFCCQW